jgi:hypothetical protein
MGKTLKVIQVTLEERLMATRPNVYVNKTKYNRNGKNNKYRKNYDNEE